MIISYAITVCNEFVEIQKLIPFLLKHKRSEDNIVVLFDQKNGDMGALLGHCTGFIRKAVF